MGFEVFSTTQKDKDEEQKTRRTGGFSVFAEPEKKPSPVQKKPATSTPPKMLPAHKPFTPSVTEGTNLDPEFLEAHPTFKKVAETVVSASRKIDETPAGRFLGRVGQRAGETATAGEAATAPDVGRLNPVADLLGFGLSFAVPGGVTSAASKAGTLATQAAKVGGKIAPAVVKGATMGGVIGGAEATAKRETPAEAVKTVGKEAALWAGFELGGVALGAAGKALWAKVPESTKESLLKRFSKEKVAKVVEETAQAPDWRVKRGVDFVVDEYGNITPIDRAWQAKLPGKEPVRLPEPPKQLPEARTRPLLPEPTIAPTRPIRLPGEVPAAPVIEQGGRRPFFVTPEGVAIGPERYGQRQLPSGERPLLPAKNPRTPEELAYEAGIKRSQRNIQGAPKPSKKVRESKTESAVLKPEPKPGTDMTAIETAATKSPVPQMEITVDGSGNVVRVAEKPVEAATKAGTNNATNPIIPEVVNKPAETVGTVPSAANQTLKTGDEVKLVGLTGKHTVVDVGDSSMVKVRNEKGTEFVVGRKAVKPAAEGPSDLAPALQTASDKGPMTAKPSNITTGKAATAKTERGTTVETQYAVVNADDIVSSHTIALNRDQRYPAELQPRERSRAASEAQINQIVTKLEPEFLGESPKASEGAPIVASDMVVESGNGRVIALKRAYTNQHPNSKKYQEWLLSNAERFGIDKATLEKTQNPVLVRVRQSEVDRVKFAQEANEQSVGAMSATEQASQDAKYLSQNLMSRFVPNETGEINTAVNRDFVKAFIGNAVSPAETGRYITKDGALSQEGIARIRNALYARAYGDVTTIEKMAESLDNNVRNITNAMLSAAPRFASIKDGISKKKLYDLDITPEISDAVNKLSSLRDKGMSVQDYLDQAQLFGEEISPMAKDILALFDQNKRSAKKLGEFLRAYTYGVEAAGNPNQSKMFTTGTPTKADILEAATRRISNAGKEDQFVLFPEPNQRTERKVASTPDAGIGSKKGATETVPASASAAESAIRANRAEIADALKEAEKPVAGMSVRAVPGGAGGASTGPYASTASKVEQAYQAGQKAAVPLGNRIRQAMSNIVKDFEYEPTLREFPRVKEHVRRTLEIPANANRKSTQALEGIVGDLTKDEMEIFSRKAIFEDWAEGAGRGEKLPFDLTEAEVKAELASINKGVTPKIEAAYKRHVRMVKAVADDLITRGKINPEQTREAYYPHKILQDYSFALDDRIPGLPQKLKTPFRGYTKQRVGSDKPIATNYIDTMHAHLMKVDVDNALDDAIENLATVGEGYAKKAIPADTLKKLKKTLAPGEAYSHEGQVFRAWQPEAGNYKYEVDAVAADKLADDLAVAATNSEALAALQEHLRKVLAVGSKKPTFILPGEVADRLNAFRRSDFEAEITKQLQGYTNWWKRMAVLTPGPGFDFTNMFGDTDNFIANLGLEGAGDAFKKAARMLKDKDPALEKLLAEGVFSSEVYTFGGGKYQSTVLRNLSGPKAKFAYYNPLSMYERFRVQREALGRIAAYLLNADRVAVGKTIKNNIVDVEGLLPEEAVAKVARETMIDYKALGKSTEKMKKFSFPFVTWYAENFRNWAKYVKNNPVKGLARIFLPLAGLELWNRMAFPDVEKRLPSYIRENPHLITGVKNKDGGYYVIPIPLSGAVAASVFGLQKMPDRIASMFTGEITMKEALKEQGKDVALGPAGTLLDLLSPFIKTPVEIAANKNFFLDSKIVPERLKGTPEERKIQRQYVVENFLPPVQKGARMQGKASEGSIPEQVAASLTPGGIIRGVTRTKAYDVASADRNAIYDNAENAEARHRANKAVIEKAFIKSQVEGKPELLNQAVEGRPITRQEFVNMAKSSRVQIAIVNGKMAREKDPQKREQLKQKKKALQDYQAQERLKSVPKAARQYLP